MCDREGIENRAFSVLMALLMGVFLPAGVAAEESPRVLSVEILDEGDYAAGSVGSLSVDLSQKLCGTAPSQTDEPFYDTVVATTIRNPTNLELNVRNVRYRLRTSNGGRARLSQRLSPSSYAAIPPKGQGRVLSLFLKANAGGKRLTNLPEQLSTDLGIQHVRLVLQLRSSTGAKYRIRKRIAMAFGEYDRCSG